MDSAESQKMRTHVHFQTFRAFKSLLIGSVEYRPIFHLPILPLDQTTTTLKFLGVVSLIEYRMYTVGEKTYPEPERILQVTIQICSGKLIKSSSSSQHC